MTVFDQLQRALDARRRMFLGFDFGIALVFLFGAVSAWIPRREA